MASPTFTKSYTGGISCCNRVVFASAAQCFQDEVFAMISFMKAHGWECVGSSNGAAAAMDGPGTDRIASAANFATRGTNTTSPQSWWIGKRTDGAMGGAKVMIAYEGGGANQCKISVSIGGGTGFTIAGTATHQPTDANQIVVQPAGTPLDGGAASLDRLWSAWQSTDGNLFMFAIARANAWVRWVRIGIETPAITAPAVWDVPLVGFSLATMNHNALILTNAGAVGRINGGTGYVQATFFGGVEGYKNAIGPVSANYNPQAQGGGGPPFFPMSWWAETATAQGKWANAFDLFAWTAGTPDGNTFPSAGPGLRRAIAMGPYIVAWDGTPSVDGTPVVMA